MNFGKDNLSDELILAYAKLKEGGQEVVSVFMSRTREKLETVFRVNEVAFDESKLQMSKAGSGEATQAEIQSLRIDVLAEFIDAMVENILLDESGATRLIVPYFTNLDEPAHKKIVEKISTPDEVQLNTRTRQIVILCAA